MGPIYVESRPSDPHTSLRQLQTIDGKQQVPIGEIPQLEHGQMGQHRQLVGWGVRAGMRVDDCMFSCVPVDNVDAC